MEHLCHYRPSAIQLLIVLSTRYQNQCQLVCKFTKLSAGLIWGYRDRYEHLSVSQFNNNWALGGFRYASRVS